MKKRLTYKVLIIAVVILIAALTPLLLGQLQIRNVELQMYYPDKTIIINQKDMVNYITGKYGELKNYRRNQIDTKELKEYIEQSDFVQKATVNISMLGDVRISVHQREVLARVFFKNGNSYYIDKECNTIRYKQNQPKVKCVIVTANLKDRAISRIDTNTDKQLTEVYNIVKYIHGDNTLRNWLSEVIVEKKDIRLMPIQGDYEILSDKPNVLSNLEKLHYLYEYSFKTKGWDDYELIDLRYHNQIVCRKFDRTKKE